MTTDEDLLGATHRAVMRVGPHLTLADIAKEAGVSAPTLVQRFRSKRDLLLKLASVGAERTDEQFAAIRRVHKDPLDALREMARCAAQMAPTPEAVSNALAFLQMDLRDPQFHQFAHAQARATLLALKQALDDAVKLRQLARCDTARLAFALHSAIGGAMIAWAVLREGKAEEAILAAVETLLEPRLRRRPRQTLRRTSEAPLRVMARVK